MYPLIIIDDEPSICQSLRFALEDRYQVYSFTEPNAALLHLEKMHIPFVLLDLKIGTVSGLEVLQEIKQRSPQTIVIMMTAFGSISTIIETIKKGAFYYITKPLHIEELEALLEKAEEFYIMRSKVELLEQEPHVRGFIGKSPKVKDIFSIMEKIRDIDSNILITGESGTGKELIAKNIHYQSKRKNRNFLAINCAAIPPTLLEAELFGYERGAFTGALERKPGLFTLADGGTILLDEIGEMKQPLQGKILRVLQDKRLIPVGGTKEITVDFRIIAATNRDLKKEVEAERFRQDLYYRLNVIPIHLPPLRERKEDIPLLVHFFIRKISEQMGKPVEGISQGGLNLLEQYDFPGNVRELQNIIERTIALTNSTYIQKEDLPAEMVSQDFSPIRSTLIPIYIGEPLEQVEKKVILKNLAAMDGNQRRTAQMIGIGERTLRDKLKKYRDQ